MRLAPIPEDKSEHSPFISAMSVSTKMASSRRASTWAARYPPTKGKFNAKSGDLDQGDHKRRKLHRLIAASDLFRMGAFKIGLLIEFPLLTRVSPLSPKEPHKPL
jgi:hypothetical protein